MQERVFEKVDLKYYRKEVATSFHEKGFALGTKILTDGYIEKIKVLIQQFLSQPGKHGSAYVQNLGAEEEPIIQFQNMWMEIDEVADILRQSVLHDMLSAICDKEEFFLFHDQMQYKPAKKGGVNFWHQDVQFWPFVEPYSQVTGWIALDDATVENGCMRMVNGSHKWGDATPFLSSISDYYSLPPAYEGHGIQIEHCVVPKGHVHFHQHLTWHGSGHNRSNLPRRALAFHFMCGDSRYKPKDRYVIPGQREGELIRGWRYPKIGTPFATWKASNREAEVSLPA